MAGKAPSALGERWLGRQGVCATVCSTIPVSAIEEYGNLCCHNLNSGLKPLTLWVCLFEMASKVIPARGILSDSWALGWVLTYANSDRWCQCVEQLLILWGGKTVWGRVISREKNDGLSLGLPISTVSHTPGS